MRKKKKWVDWEKEKLKSCLKKGGKVERKTSERKKRGKWKE